MRACNNWIQYALLILAPFILLSPVVFAGKALFWGTPALQFHPWRVFALDTLRSGQIPLWNPLLGMGAPLIANYQSGFFYPPNWFYFLLGRLGGEVAMAWGQGFLVSLHLAFSCLGMARLVKALGMGVLSQTISGLAFGLSGYLIARAGFLSINASVAWVPWIMMGIYQLVVKISESGHDEMRSRLVVVRYVIILALIIGMQFFAGHAQTTWYSILLAVVWTGFWGWENNNHLNKKREGWRIRLKRVGLSYLGLGIAMIIGVALAAVQLFPTGELLLQSQRGAGADLDFVMTYSFWPWRFLTLLLPNLFGNPAHGNYWGYASFWEDAVYIGLLPLILAFVAVFRGTRDFIKKRRTRRIVILLVLIILVSFLLALGKNTPVFPWLYHYVPTFNMFQAPARMTIWAVFALSLLAGIGADSWLGPNNVKKKTRILRWVVGAFAILLSALAARVILQGIEPSFLRAFAQLGLLGVGSGLLAFFAPESKESRRYQPWCCTVIVFVALDLLIAGWGLNPGIELSFYQREPPNAEGVRELLGSRRLYLPDREEYQLKFDQFFRFDSFDRDWGRLRSAYLPNLNVLDNLAAVNNFDPLLPGRYVRWIDEVNRLFERHIFSDRADLASLHLLNLMNVGVVEKVDSNSSSGVAFIPIEGLPRVRWVPCSLTVADEEAAWEQIGSNSIDFTNTVVLEGSESVAQKSCSPAKSAQIQMLNDSPNEIQLSVETSSPGWLVLADVWYPGWKAILNENEVSIHRANYLFRAVEIPAGSNVIKFIYRPFWFALGAGISAVTLLALMIGLVYAKGR